MAWHLGALEIIPMILFVVVLVTAVAERINLPYPLLLVVAGLMIGFVPGLPNWRPSSDVILALFLPPILFAAARKISARDIQNYKRTIISLSFALVLFSTFFIAILLNLLTPHLNFHSALVLGAIISPTDTVAAIAVLSKLHVEKRVIKTIEMESLFNDAMGIVLYGAAISFIAVNQFHVYDFSKQLFFAAAGGILIGVVLAILSRIIIENFLVNSQNELVTIMSLVLAYVSFLLAERLDYSAVLAVVTAGLMHKRSERILFADTRIKETSVWDTLIFFLNGLIFTVIGIQFPHYLKHLSYMPKEQLFILPIITVLSLFALRYAWITLTYFFTHPLARPTDKKTYAIPFKRVLLFSWSGMRGLVPLALAIALPEILPGGKNFPHRDLIIYLTITTILISLLVQGLSLPSVIRFLGFGQNPDHHYVKTAEIYQMLTERTIRQLTEFLKEEHSDDAKQLIKNYYANRLLHIEVQYASSSAARNVRYEAKILLHQILKSERKILNDMRHDNEITEEVYALLIKKLDQDEVGFTSFY